MYLVFKVPLQSSIVKVFPVVLILIITFFTKLKKLLFSKTQFLLTWRPQINLLLDVPNTQILPQYLWSHPYIDLTLKVDTPVAWITFVMNSALVAAVTTDGHGLSGGETLADLYAAYRWHARSTRLLSAWCAHRAKMFLQIISYGHAAGDNS